MGGRALRPPVRVLGASARSCWRSRELLVLLWAWERLGVGRREGGVGVRKGGRGWEGAGARGTREGDFL